MVPVGEAKAAAADRAAASPDLPTADKAAASSDPPTVAKAAKAVLLTGDKAAKAASAADSEVPGALA